MPLILRENKWPGASRKRHAVRMLLKRIVSGTDLQICTEDWSNFKRHSLGGLQFLFQRAHAAAGGGSQTRARAIHVWSAASRALVSPSAAPLCLLELSQSTARGRTAWIPRLSQGRASQSRNQRASQLEEGTRCLSPSLSAASLARSARVPVPVEERNGQSVVNVTRSKPITKYTKKKGPRHAHHKIQ